ncbi:unnamed protein product [Cladocopium goreaui]|uniref:Probable E3 ubiquitin-protein ligase LUL3 (Probable RING-type E3 ubiquitin transferase LUL3) (Protein LOG2-LIKE UBIQUITIN LIGASE 3) (RING finger protein 398) n=1 Tax=Cladocopium goreaui TaxID=2562237 RepID=A0A9P1FJW6_9DINO|nr:unnamed protein product [Cladocopium goreaui]
MGGNASQPVDLPALPQQRIVNVRDGQAEPMEQQPQIGTLQQAVAVRPTLSLVKGAVRGDGSGVLTVEIAATASGHVELILPAQEVSSADVAWPRISMLPSSKVQRLSIAASSGSQSISFNCAVSLESLSREKRAGLWPAVLVLRPGPAPVGTLVEEPPDGTMLAFCEVKAGSLNVVRQIIAWGGNGKAFEMKDMFGLQDAKASEDANSSQRNCVICLTNPRDTAVLPCRHFCVCYDCGLSIRLTPSRSKCPLCRADVKDLVRIEWGEAEAEARNGA